MTTHILIVDKNTFNQHLQYLFIGTGNGEPFMMNGIGKTSKRFNPTKEKNQFGMLADFNRLRIGDYVIFYLQQKGNIGGFFGLFKVASLPFIHSNHNDKYPNLTKELEYRALIKPCNVYESPVSEWEALDDIKQIQSPFQMLWSLIYRKLKGNRGNTMITLYESERLIYLLMQKNNQKSLKLKKNESLVYNKNTNQIEITNGSFKKYEEKRKNINIINRIVYKNRCNHKYETHLQAYITQYIGTNKNKTLDNSILSNKEKVIWIGNEVSCGVGMQRMDIVIVTESNAQQINNLYIIELKCCKMEPEHVRQMYRYVDWIYQYYIPNKPSIVQPILITKGNSENLEEIKKETAKFNSYTTKRNVKSLRFINYKIEDNNIIFENYELHRK